MQKYRFRLMGSDGSLGVGTYRTRIDVDAGLLRLGHLRIGLHEIMKVTLEYGQGKMADSVLLDFFGPSINMAQPTQIRLSAKYLLTSRQRKVLEDFVAQMQPLIEGNEPQPWLATDDAGQSAMLTPYVVDLGFLLFFIRQEWIDFDPPGRIVRKSLLLMFLNGILNTFCILLLVAPFDNLTLRNNLINAGWRPSTAGLFYALALLPPILIWIPILRRILA